MSEGARLNATRDLGWASRLRALTPARVGLGQTGVSLETRDLLDFQRCHAMARDAVHSHLEVGVVAAALAAITENEVVRLHSAAKDRATYLQRPDLGRRLNEASREILSRQVAERIADSEDANAPLLAIIVADGLSSLGVERHAVPLVAELLPRLAGWRIAASVAQQVRVAIGDEIGEALGAELSVVLIGERPGLSSADSLGAYITWQPRPGRTDAERNCISNIRDGGLTYSQAASQLVYYLTEAKRRQLTGIALKEATHLLEESQS